MFELSLEIPHLCDLKYFQKRFILKDLSLMSAKNTHERRESAKQVLDQPYSGPPDISMIKQYLAILTHISVLRG